MNTINISYKGRPVRVPCLSLKGRTIVIKGKILRIANIYDDFLDNEEIEDPQPFIQLLKNRADLITLLGSFRAAVNKEDVPSWQLQYQPD